MSSKMTIIEGNSNDKDNVRAYMVKGEPGTDGVSPTITPSRSGEQTTLTIKDGEGTKQAVINDGFSPTVETSKEDGVTTVEITDLNGTKTTEIVDGIDMTGGVPTDGVIGFDGVAADIPDGYEAFNGGVSLKTLEGTELSFSNNDDTSLSEIVLKGNTTQNGTPTPDSPVDVEVVTGTNTITISDGGSNTQNFSINLGSLELNKIGDNRDRIYKNNGNWYIEKNVGKVVLDGSESCSRQVLSNNIVRFMFTGKVEGMDGTRQTIFSNYFVANLNTLNDREGIGFIYGNLLYLYKQKASVADFQTWLNTHNTLVYYVLATPTTTQITDTTLISQLDDLLLNATIFAGTTTITQTNADLPFILRFTAVTNDICIKKVEVTPIDRNYASVVDSKATQDDKTKNTYSMRVIDNELSNKADTSDLDNYYTKTETDEVLTSEKFHFLAGDEGGELDVVFKRVGKIVFVYYYPIVYGVQSDLQTMSIMDTIELPEWAQISETPQRNINICSKFNCSGWSSSTSDGISLGSISRFSIVKQTNGLYRLRYSYVDTNPAYTDPPENVYLVGENTSYLVY